MKKKPNEFVFEYSLWTNEWYLQFVQGGAHRALTEYASKHLPHFRKDFTLATVRVSKNRLKGYKALPLMLYNWGYNVFYIVDKRGYHDSFMCTPIAKKLLGITNRQLMQSKVVKKYRLYYKVVSIKEPK
jgi:hypothetical protein